MIAINNVEEIRVLEYLFSSPLKVKLFTTDIGPLTKSMTAASFTEAAGDTYAEITLLSSEWTHTPGGDATASYSVYNETIEWLFEGAIDGTGIIYGYYVVTTLGVLRWSEEFSAPFTPVAGARIRFIPRFSCNSLGV